MMTATKPLPDIDRPLTATFWAALRERRIAVQRCTDCGTTRYPAAPLCPSCLARHSEWVDLSAEGEIWSYVVYRRALSPAFADEVPYAVGVVIVDGLQFVTKIDGPLDSIRVGGRAQAQFTDVSDEVTLLSFRPVEAGSADE
jgi:uncharacterized protein